MRVVGNLAMSALPIVYDYSDHWSMRIELAARDQPPGTAVSTAAARCSHCTLPARAEGSRCRVARALCSQLCVHARCEDDMPNQILICRAAYDGKSVVELGRNHPSGSVGFDIKHDNFKHLGKGGPCRWVELTAVLIAGQSSANPKLLHQGSRRRIRFKFDN